jgi:hypothetical protein
MADLRWQRLVGSVRIERGRRSRRGAIRGGQFQPGSQNGNDRGSREPGACSPGGAADPLAAMPDRDRWIRALGRARQGAGSHGGFERAATARLKHFAPGANGADTGWRRWGIHKLAGYRGNPRRPAGRLDSQRHPDHRLHPWIRAGANGPSNGNFVATTSARLTNHHTVLWNTRDRDPG